MPDLRYRDNGTIDPTATKYAAYLAIHRTAGTTPRSFDDWRAEYERARYVTAQEVDAAVRDWSPPTEAQKEAGNYQKPTINWKGLTIKIETPRGQRRKPEFPEMPCHYGYFSKVGRDAAPDAADGDKCDVFVAENLDSDLGEYHQQEKTKAGYDVTKTNRQYWHHVGQALERGEQVPDHIAAEYRKLFGTTPEEEPHGPTGPKPAPAGKTAPEPPTPKAEDDRPLDPGGRAGPGGPEGVGSGDPKKVTKPTEEPDVSLRDHDPEIPTGKPDEQRGLGDDRGGGGTEDPLPDDRAGQSGGGPEGRVRATDPPAGMGEQPGPLPDAGHGSQALGKEPPAADPGDEDEPPEDEAQPEGPPGVNEPYEPLDPEVPEIDDSEPPEEYLAHERPNDLGERIKAGDAAAADEVVRRLDEQYPEDAQGPKADRARAIRKKLVEDFGEKIGGARKDTARPLGKRGGADKPRDDRPGWARRYEVGQIAKSTNKAEEGKWAVHDTKHKNWYGQPRQIGVFATKEEAERSIPLAEVARSHEVRHRDLGPDSNVEPGSQKRLSEYAIVRKVSDRKHPVVKAGFASREDAMKYMAQHPEEIIEHQFPRYEQYQYLDHVQRQGGTPRAGNTTPQDFHQEFGFRGGEFGNWQSGRDGQEALNHAHDALRDLADVLGVQPGGISLNGDLAIAFGARGTGGKDAARAHYEPGARVINLTKMRGAGTLAHEFAHALDNYFARQTKLPGERYGKYNWVTEGLPYKHNLRPEVATAWTGLVKAMMGKEETKAIDPTRVEKQKQHHWDHVKTRIDSLETSLAGDKQYNKRHKGLTAEQQAEWDAAKQAILSGQPGDKQYVDGRTRYGGYQTYGNLAKLNQLYKAATGRSFHTATKGNPGQDLYWSIQASQDAEKAIGEAQAGATETKKRPTNYYNAARDLDETRASSYYMIPTEMLARAFEAYVYDKLAAENRRSDYLVGKAENKYYKMFDMAPFPEGDERTAINAAFDHLFATMQQRPRSDDKGEHVELYSAEPLREFAKELYAAYFDRYERARYTWSEGQHPRGQPENHGEFAVKNTTDLHPSLTHDPQEHSKLLASGDATAWRIHDGNHPLPARSKNTWNDDSEFMPGVSGYANLVNAVGDLLFGDHESVSGDNYATQAQNPVIVAMNGRYIDGPGAEVVVPQPKIAAVITKRDVESAIRRLASIDESDRGLPLDELLGSYAFDDEDREAIAQQIMQDLKQRAP